MTFKCTSKCPYFWYKYKSSYLVCTMFDNCNDAIDSSGTPLRYKHDEDD